MPFKGQFAFISTEEVSSSQLPRIAAHELAHGTFRLYHTFSDKNDYIVPQGTTDNLMDYNDGEELHKYQWDLVQDPQGSWFSGLIDEEEGAWRNVKGKIRSVVELSRFGYAFNRNIKLSNNNLTAYNLTLGDGHEYNKLAVYIKEDATVSNTQNKFTRDIPELTFDGDNKDRFGFGYSGERGKLEFITSNDNADKLGEYITGQETSQQWKNAVKDQISNYDERLKDINVMPDGALKAFTNDLRIDLLKAIAEKDDNDYFHLAARVIKNVPEIDIEDFFEKLDQKNLLYTLDNAMKQDDYTRCIFELLVHFYRQSQENLKSKTIDGTVLTWHKPEATINTMGERRTQINYTTGYSDDGEIYLKGKIRQVRPPEQKLYTKELPREELNPFSLVGVHFSSSPSFLNVQAGKVLPMPAFFFKWINDEHFSRVVDQGTELAFTMVSLTFGVGEFIEAKNSIRVASAIIGLMKQTGDICFNHPEIREKLLPLLGEENSIVKVWDKISIALSMISLDLKLLDESYPWFDEFALAWQSIDRNSNTWQQIESKLTESEIESIEEVVEIINEN